MVNQRVQFYFLTIIENFSHKMALDTISLLSAQAAKLYGQLFCIQGAIKMKKCCQNLGAFKWHFATEVVSFF